MPSCIKGATFTVYQVSWRVTPALSSGICHAVHVELEFSSPANKTVCFAWNTAITIMFYNAMRINSVCTQGSFAMDVRKLADHKSMTTQLLAFCNARDAKVSIKCVSFASNSRSAVGPAHALCRPGHVAAGLLQHNTANAT